MDEALRNRILTGKYRCEYVYRAEEKEGEASCPSNRSGVVAVEVDVSNPFSGILTIADWLLRGQGGCIKYFS